MSQSLVIERLMKTPNEWVSKDELVKYCGVSPTSVSQSIMRLVKFGEVERRYERHYNKDKPKSNIILTFVKIDKDYYKRLKMEGLV